jgi:branched-chain amino acid transport system substrate-binding protein
MKNPMTNQWKALLTGVAASAAVLLAGCPPQNQSSNTATNGGGQTTATTVKVAANLPMSGALATYGSAVREGASMAVDEMQGDASAPKLEFDWQDNASDPKNAVTIMQKQFLQTPEIYVSGVKPQTMAIIDQVKAKGTPHFVWIFDAFINKNSNNNFRTWVSYKIEPPVYLDYAKRHNAKRVAIVYVQLPHTLEEFNQIVVPGLKKQGATLLVEPYDFGKSDFKDVAVKFKNFKPDLMILNGFQNELVGMVRAMRPLGLMKDGNTLATYDMLDAAKVLGKDELEGVRQVAPTFVVRPDRAEATKWNTDFKSKYNKEPLYTHAYAYDMAKIIADAAKRVQQPATSEGWIAALRQTDIQGVTGPLKFDKQGDLITPLEVGVYRNGKLVPDAGAQAAPVAKPATGKPLGALKPVPAR